MFFRPNKIVTVSIGCLPKCQFHIGIGSTVFHRCQHGAGYLGAMFFQQFRQSTETAKTFIHRSIFTDGSGKVVGRRCLARSPVIEIGTTYRHIVTDTTKSSLKGIKRNVLCLHRCHTVLFPTQFSGYITIPTALKFPGNKRLARLGFQLLVNQTSEVLLYLPSGITVHHIHHPVQRTLGHIARFRSPTSNNRNIDAIFTGKFR